MTQTYTTQLDTTKLLNGPHIISATACDKAGNCTTAQETVYVNNKPPAPQAPGLLGIIILVVVILAIGIAVWKGKN